MYEKWHNFAASQYAHWCAVHLLYSFFLGSNVKISTWHRFGKDERIFYVTSLELF